MATPTGICNIALAHIGAAQIASMDPPDGSVLAGLCARLYPVARREMLEHPWRFALRRAQLALLPEAAGGWDYSYALPSDCVRALRVELTGVLSSVFDETTNEPEIGEGASFVTEGSTLHTNQPEAELLYTADVVDTAAFSPAFGAALAKLLAGYLAGAVIKGREGLSIRASLHGEAARAAENALVVNANKEQLGWNTVPAAVLARR